MTRLFRYRKPSVKTRVGVTKAKKRLNRATGITAAKRPFRAPQNMERRVLRRAGYYSGPMKFMRFLGNVMHRQPPHNQPPFNSQPTEAYRQPQQPYMLYPPPPPPPPPGQFQPPPPPPRPLPHTRFLTWWKKRMKVLLPVFVVILAMLLSACGGSAQSSSSSPSITATSTPSPTPTPHVAHVGKTADQLLQGLKAHGLPIGVSFTYTAANDLNHLLGRPGQYIGKVNFKDTRITSTEQGAAISVSDGGSIEVFTTTSEAKKRFAYIQALSKSGVGLFAEYEYLDGVVILRISSQLTPDQAAAYQVALKALP